MKALRDNGYAVVLADDVGLRGRDDAFVFQYAREHHLTLLTRDADFGEQPNYVPPHEEGILISREPGNIKAGERAAHIIAGLERLNSVDITHRVYEIGPMGTIQEHPAGTPFPSTHTLRREQPPVEEQPPQRNAPSQPSQPKQDERER